MGGRGGGVGREVATAIKKTVQRSSTDTRAVHLVSGEAQ